MTAMVVVLWLNATDLMTQQTYPLPSGTYTLWVWAEGGKAVDVNGQRAGETPVPEQGGPFVWSNLGPIEVENNEVTLEVTQGPIAALVLAGSEAFDPREAMKDRYVYDQPQAVPDARPGRERETRTVFTMPHFASKADWEAHAERLRTRILIGTGLYPLPEKTPLNARVFDEIERDDYIVAKATFEAWPGFLVTGNLYRPKGDGPFPGVVGPHGHWAQGRLEDSERGSVPARGITLARMGMVHFTYDMLGYVDSKQVDHGFYDRAQALYGVHPFALQLWSSIRAVDFLQSLPYVDAERIGCTGASGGGTQTFALSAVDPRVKVSAPVNMISSTMQGGCVCENAPLIRMSDSNMEIGALAAPRPMLLVSATGDWTRETPWVEYPAIKSVYALYDAEDHLSTVLIDAPHNYNLDSREAVYRFLGGTLLGDPAAYANYAEPPYSIEPEEALRIFPGDAQPEGHPGKEDILRQVIEAVDTKWDAVLPKSKGEIEAFRTGYGAALANALNASTPPVNSLHPERIGREARLDYTLERYVIHHPESGAAIPALVYRPLGKDPVDAVLVVHGEGKAALADPMGGPGALVMALLKEGKAVMAIDPFLTGEFHDPRQWTERRQDAFPDTFLPSDTAYRVQDILTSFAYLNLRRDLTGTVQLVGLDEGGVWAVLAGAVEPGIAGLVADANAFDIKSDAEWVKRHYVPGIRGIGGITTAAYLLASRSVAVMNTQGQDWAGAMAPAFALTGKDLQIDEPAWDFEQIAGWLRGARDAASR